MLNIFKSSSGVVGLLGGRETGTKHREVSSRVHPNSVGSVEGGLSELAENHIAACKCALFYIFCKGFTCWGKGL